jgi:hypothetical protein
VILVVVFAVVPTRYTTVNVGKTMEEVLGTGLIRLWRGIKGDQLYPEHQVESTRGQIAFSRCLLRLFTEHSIQQEVRPRRRK